MSYWQNLRIGVRLALGIGLVLILLVVVAAASYLGLTKGNSNFGDYRLMARQTSAAGAGLLERDPENRWLARGPRYRRASPVSPKRQP